MPILGRFIIAFISLSAAAFMTGHPVIGGILAYAGLLLLIVGMFHFGAGPRDSEDHDDDSKA